MPLFNAVLLPAVDFRDRLVDFAQDKYAKIADGYCLSQTSYPHITLAQFEAEDQPMIFLEDVFEPQFTHFNLRDGSGDHDGFVWVEWAVQKEQWLSDLQNGVIESLKGEGANITSAIGDEYQPHLTFCRVPKSKEEKVDPALIEQAKLPWIFTIGSSDKNGQFLG